MMSITKERKRNLTQKEKSMLLFGNLTACWYMCSLYSMPERKPARTGKKLSTLYNFIRMANLLTLFRLFVTFPTVVAILKGEMKLALLLALLGAVSDVADGFLARRNGNVNGLGKLLDPFADKVFSLSVLVALSGTGAVSALPVVLLLFRDLSVSFLRTLAALQGLVLEASLLGKVKTFLVFTSIVVLIGGFREGELVLWGGVLVSYVSVYDYVRSYLRESSGLNYP